MTTGALWFAIGQLSPQVGKQRSLNLNDPYICLSGLSSCPQTCAGEDYLPVQGETGIELYIDVEGLPEGIRGEFTVTGPDRVEKFPAKISGDRLSFISQACTFSQPALHEVVLEIRFPSGGLRRLARRLYVNQ